MGWKEKGTGKEVKAATVPSKKEKVEKKMSEPAEQEMQEMVVDELPQIPTRQVHGEDGKLYSLVTKNEAIQEILEHVRVIRKHVEE